VASAAEVERLNEIIADLQRRVQDLAPAQPSREDRHATIDSEPSYRETSFAPSNFTSAPHKPKIKVSDLPKSSGRDTEDVDQWIEKVSAIYEYSGVHDSDLL
jgi:hypothetical protein